MSVQQNTALTNIDGLANLTSVGGEFVISMTMMPSPLLVTSVASLAWGAILISYDNDALTTLGDLSSLTSVGGELYFYDNDALTTLGDLSSLTSVGGDCISSMMLPLTVPSPAWGR